MRQHRSRSPRSGGLTGIRVELITRYVAEAKGPPPREPLRFWIDGEWVEVASSDPEPLVEAVAAPPVPEPPADERRRPTELEDTAIPTQPAVVADALDPPDAIQDMPIYRWLVAEDGERGVSESEWPRSLVAQSRSRS